MPSRARRYIGRPVTSCPSRRDDAAIGRDEPGDHVEDRRLAGAVRAEQADRLAGAHGEGRVLHDGAAAIALLQTLDGEDAGAAEDRLGRRARRAADEVAPSRGTSPAGRAAGRVASEQDSSRRRWRVDDDGDVGTGAQDAQCAADRSRRRRSPGARGGGLASALGTGAHRPPDRTLRRRQFVAAFFGFGLRRRPAVSGALPGTNRAFTRLARHSSRRWRRRC